MYKKYTRKVVEDKMDMSHFSFALIGVLFSGTLLTLV